MVFVIPQKIIIALIICSELIACKRISTRDVKSKSSELSECRRCKIVVDSFNHWLDKTSRGKHEGGDAAWEETKLKSYSRSEMRLVEIQEGLCSELKTHQDACYALAEEVELVLEKWWFREDPNSVDLYTWLCIDNLKYCCPKGHFGDTCLPCSKDNDNNICSGRGKCDGDSTRKGNGTCLCKKGYSGQLCENCDKNYYSAQTGICKLCHNSCNGCTGSGPNLCDACNPGWVSEAGVCTDINECSNSVCKTDEYCTNTEGSFICKKCDLSCRTCTGEGPHNCVSCESMNVLWFNTCIEEELKQNFIVSTFKKLALYIGLLIISLFIYRTSKSLASIVILCIAVFIYYSEKSLRIPTIDVLQHLLASST